MRNVYLVAYDVCDPKRLRLAYQKMRGFGNPLQYSVFYCELSPIERQLLQQDLWNILEFSQDRVMVVDLGPSGGVGAEAIEFWGEPRTLPEEPKAVIV